MNRREAVKRIAVGAAAVPVVAETLGREPYRVAPPHGVRITADGHVTTADLQANSIWGLSGEPSKMIA